MSASIRPTAGSDRQMSAKSGAQTLRQAVDFAHEQAPFDR
jgi:hypothetical protein